MQYAFRLCFKQIPRLIFILPIHEPIYQSLFVIFVSVYDQWFTLSTFIHFMHIRNILLSFYFLLFLIFSIVQYLQEICKSIVNLVIDVLQTNIRGENFAEYQILLKNILFQTFTYACLSIKTNRLHCLYVYFP